LMTMRRLFLVVLAALPLAGCDDVSSGSPAKAAALAAATPYALTAVGRVDSGSEARQLVAAADGVISRVLVQRGQPVAAGQLLLEVDCLSRKALAQAQQAEAQRQAAAARTILDGARVQERDAASSAVASARAARADAADRLAQAQALLANGFVSRRELAARHNLLAMAEAALASAQAQASLLAAGPRASDRSAALAAAAAAQATASAAMAQARQCNLFSPIAGEVLQILRREGEFSGASQGTVLLIVGNMARRVVRAEISDRDAAQVHVGQAVDVWIEGQPARWPGRIASLAQVMGRRSARSLDPTDRFDRDVREAFVEFDGPMPPALVGLRVMVGAKP
jgi:HlyD family secretion protein